MIISRKVKGNILTVVGAFNPNNAEVVNGVHYLDDPKCRYVETITNRTPHEVVLFRSTKGGNVVDVVWGKDERPLRVSLNKLGECNDLPPYEAGSYYIVSAIVKLTHLDRSDLLTIDDDVRDNDGKIIGRLSLGK